MSGWAVPTLFKGTFLSSELARSAAFFGWGCRRIRTKTQEWRGKPLNSDRKIAERRIFSLYLP